MVKELLDTLDETKKVEMRGKLSTMLSEDSDSKDDVRLPMKRRRDETTP